MILMYTLIPKPSNSAHQHWLFKLKAAFEPASEGWTSVTSMIHLLTSIYTFHSLERCIHACLVHHISKNRGKIVGPLFLHLIRVK